MKEYVFELDPVRVKFASAARLRSTSEEKATFSSKSQMACPPESDDFQYQLRELERTAQKLAQRQNAIVEAEKRTTSMQQVIDQQRDHIEERKRNLEFREQSLIQSEERVRMMAQQSDAVDAYVSQARAA